MQKCLLKDSKNLDFDQTSRTNVEILDDYGCPKIQEFVGKRKTDSSLICSSYPFRHKTILHCAERKGKVYGERAMQRL